MEAIRLIKIPLGEFLETLNALYERGADYVDLIAIPNVEQDMISVVVRNEYMIENHTFDEGGLINGYPLEFNEGKLTDDDIKNITDLT